MTLSEFAMKSALDVEALNVILGAAIGIVVTNVIGALGFFLKRVFSSGDEQAKMIRDLTKDFGKLEMKNDACFRHIEELREDIRDLRRGK